ncbi:flavin reductase family protein [Agrobacterium tumefaciens]|uniref:Flavin reductase family protein n=2 Tax=Agrobacterium tumefaciens TaxID=358 RepID=A0AA44F631_AGRTU|nr:flavin reductase family protein [Agrobacterium tumefaciens]NSL21317.1 flavin reductase family protein [Agrobacterium tumefaciens]NTB83889.1 flavin reductase family protein [Agrobacterium tumefaciens]NTC20642.1 flavin reductase family protein [Agrobacterium tumefaciens]NTC29360.1 flavin reductase family protein [Agrobacterium tumefaciens]NTC57856.1 flavin reductase family protein [Agrobacterium tumefaciens]
MIIDSKDLDANQAYKLLIATVVPRAIGWLSTVSVDGVANLAPFSFFTVVGRKPPVLSISMQPRSDGITLKDSFINIRDTREFVANLVTLPIAEQMHRSAVEHPSEVDEFEITGLEKAPSVIVKPPRVALAPVAMECVLERIIPVGDQGDHVVWGEVVRFHIRDDIYLENGRIDTAAVAPVGRLAAEYTLVENVFTTPLDLDILVARQGARMHRLDGKPADWSAVAQKNWSASGSVIGD